MIDVLPYFSELLPKEEGECLLLVQNTPVTCALYPVDFLRSRSLSKEIYLQQLVAS